MIIAWLGGLPRRPVSTTPLLLLESPLRSLLATVNPPDRIATPIINSTIGPISWGDHCQRFNDLQCHGSIL